MIYYYADNFEIDLESVFPIYYGGGTLQIEESQVYLDVFSFAILNKWQSYEGASERQSAANSSSSFLLKSTQYNPHHLRYEKKTCDLLFSFPFSFFLFRD